ncbi:unnamed protein product [Closterium sp. Naga37s-1]|nr:unnamed protein product [Closterium sp. Naga37s-1]
MAPFWEFRVHSEPNPHPQLGRKPRPSALLIPEPVNPPPTPRPHASQLPRPSAPLPKIRTEPLWLNQPPVFFSSHPIAPIAEPAVSSLPPSLAPSLAPPPAPRPAQARKPRQRPPRQPKLWDLIPELPPAPRPYKVPQPSSGYAASAPLAHPHGQPFAPPFWQPAPRNPSRQVSIGFPTAGVGGVIDLSTWGSAKTAARGDYTLSVAATSLDTARARQHRDSCTCSVDYASLWGSLLSAAADVALVIAVVSQYEQQQEDKLRSSQPQNAPVLIPSLEHTQHEHNSAPPIGRKPRPAVLVIPAVLPPPASPLPLPPAPHRRPDQIQARAQQLQGEPHARQGGPRRRARQLKIWDLQPELPPAPHLRHDRALEREFAQQLRNLPPELPPASQPDAGLPEAPPSDGACGGGATGRSALCSPNGGGLCGTAHCARCDWLSRPRRWPSIGFPVRRSAQLAQQAEQVAHHSRRINVLAEPSCSDPESRPAGKMAPAYPAGSSADPVIPAEPPRQQQPSVPHALPIDEPALFRARSDGFPPPPCAFTSTPADVPLETPRASRSVVEPWGGTAELAQAQGSRGLAESTGAALVGGDWRKLPAPGWYRRRDWGIGNARNAIRGVSVRASTAAVAPLPLPPTVQRTLPMVSHAPLTGELAVQSNRSSITRMHSVPTERERTDDECTEIEANPRSKSHRATCLPISGEAIQTHVASLWLTVLSQLYFLGEVSTAFLGEVVPGRRNRQEQGEEWSGNQAGSSIIELSHTHGREQAVGPAAALMIGGSRGEGLVNAAAMQARLLADPPMLSPDVRYHEFSGFNVSGFNTGGPGAAATCGTTTVNLGNLASPPFNMGSLQPLPIASSFHLGEVLSATPPVQGTTAKNRTEPGRPYLRLRSTLSGQSSDLDTCRKGTGHSPASILDSPVPSDDSSCDSRPELLWSQPTLSLRY